MRNIILKYLTFSVFLGLISCSQGVTPGDEPAESTDKVITFRASLAAGDSRAVVIDTRTFKECFVTCFDPNADDPSVPYFESEDFIKSGDKFYADSSEPITWPQAGGKLYFYAYYPSIDSLNTTAGTDQIAIVNDSKVVNGKLNIDYYIDNFIVARDISHQVDFVKAYTAEALSNEAEMGVKLDFRHQLSRVELKIYRGQNSYNFQIAGLRLGNPAIYGKFHFYAGETANPWELPENPFGKVEYIYQPGDTVRTITSLTKEQAVSIMGMGGPAMVIPTKNGKWQAKTDPQMTTAGQTMYLSILVNVTLADQASNQRQLYPADGTPAEEQVSIVTFAVDKTSGIIRARLNDDDGQFYAAAGEPYTLQASDEVKEFAWAAVPIAVDWKRGKKYVYTLNYTNGIGIRDPEDPKPGDPIIGHNVGISVTYTDWEETDPQTIDVIDSTEE